MQVCLQGLHAPNKAHLTYLLQVLEQRQPHVTLGAEFGLSNSRLDSFQQSFKICISAIPRLPQNTGLNRH